MREDAVTAVEPAVGAPDEAVERFVGVFVAPAVEEPDWLAVGLIVGIFKVTFSFVWLGLVVGQLGRGSEKNQSYGERQRNQFYGFIMFVLLLILMGKLINGPAVVARRQEASFQPA